MSQTSAILDIGSGKITVLVGFRSVNQAITIVGRGECEYDGFMHGTWLTPSALSVVFGKAINDAEKMAQSKIDYLYIGVPSEFCTTVCNNAAIVLGSKMRKVTEVDMEVLYNQGNAFVNDPNDTVINIQPIWYKLDDNKTLAPIGRQTLKISARLSYTLCENGFINVVSNAIREVGIEKIEFCSSLLAESIFLIDELKRDKGVIVVDCGHLTTGVAVVKGDGLNSQFSVSVGGGHITGDLFKYFFKDIDSSEYAWGYKQIDELKKKITLNLMAYDTDSYSVSVDGEIYKFSAIVANAIVSERVKSIARTIERNLSKIDSASGLNVYLTGGGLSHIKGAKDCLQREIGRSVFIIAPVNPQFNKPQFSSPIGLLDMVLVSNSQSKSGFFNKLRVK